MFRVFQTGKNSNGNDYLALSGFELYGDYMEGTPEEISKLNSVGFVSQSLGSSVNSVSRSAPFPDAAWLCGSACNYFADLPLLGVPDTAANEVARHETRFPLIVQSNSGGASAGIYSGWTFHPNQDFAGELSRADVRGDALAEWACCFPQAQAFSTDGCLKPSVPSRQQWTRSDTTGNTSGVYVRNQTFGTSLISPANSGQTANSSNRVLMNLQLSLLWAERGEHSSTYSAQSVLRDDDSNYSSKGHHTTADLLFGRKGDPAGDSAGVLAGAYRYKLWYFSSMIIPVPADNIVASQRFACQPVGFVVEICRDAE
jgi:hypothetical protein